MLIEDIKPPKLDLRFPYPTLDRQTRDDGVRHYVCPEGKALPSVTTILSATADKSHLEVWKARVGEKKANEIRDEAANLGTLMHEHMECFLESRERPRGNNLIRQMSRRMADVIITKGLTQVDEIWGIEAPLYFPGAYAGTSDLIGVHKGAPAIMDFKNARKMRTRDMIGDYFDQMAAYSMAHNELFGTSIQKGVIFMCARDLSYETFVCEGDDFKRHEESFINRLEKYLSMPSR